MASIPELWRDFRQTFHHWKFMNSDLLPRWANEKSLLWVKTDRQSQDNLGYEIKMLDCPTVCVNGNWFLSCVWIL